MWPKPIPDPSARCRGAMNHQVGLAAEAAVARHYEGRGYRVAARRWRAQGGEIDLIVRRGCDLVIVEVKRGRTHAQAAARMLRRQQLRVLAAAEEYLFSTHLPQLAPDRAVDMRFDLATVDGVGCVEICEAAFHH